MSLPEILSLVAKIAPNQIINLIKLISSQEFKDLSSDPVILDLIRKLGDRKSAQPQVPPVIVQPPNIPNNSPERYETDCAAAYHDWFRKGKADPDAEGADEASPDVLNRIKQGTDGLPPDSRFIMDSEPKPDGSIIDKPLTWYVQFGAADPFYWMVNPLTLEAECSIANPPVVMQPGLHIKSRGSRAMFRLNHRQDKPFPLTLWTVDSQGVKSDPFTFPFCIRADA